MQIRNLFLFLSLCSVLIISSSCGNDDTPEPVEGQLVFTADGKDYAGSATFQPNVSALVLSFLNSEISFTMTLLNTTSDPLETGDRFDVDPNGNPSNMITLTFLENNESYLISSGFIDVDDFDQANNLLSVSFDLVMEKTNDPDTQIPMEGSALEVEVK